MLPINRYALLSYALAALSVALGFLGLPEAIGLPGWGRKAVIAALILASLILYRTGCSRCRT